MKLRTALSVEDAIKKVITAVGNKVAAKAVVKSSAMLYRWSDPDDTPRPSLVECLILDCLYVEEGHGEPPIFAAYCRHLESVRAPHLVMKASERFCDVMHELGDIAKEIRQCLDPNSDGGEAITKQEHARISTEISEAMQKLTELQRDVDHAADLNRKPKLVSLKEAS